MMPDLELWGGVECTYNRVGDCYFDQVARTGHAARPSDLELLAELGVRALRYPVLWEKTAPNGLASADFSWADERLERLRQLGIRVIVGLVHHGSGPAHTSLLDDSFADGLAEFAGVVARRYPWICDFTPVNEPLTTARFSALYGHWYPHRRDSRAFVRALAVQVKATVKAMRAIREVNPQARLVQTEDMCTVKSTRPLAYQALFENERRWLSLDLLFGRVGPQHPLYNHLRRFGLSLADLAAFCAEPCAPDIVGINYYVTSDRFLDHRLELYPSFTHGGNGRERYADLEAVRVMKAGITGHKGVLMQVWKRYQAPVALTEVHLGCAPEEQIRWLRHAWEGAEQARSSGADVRAVTLWSAFGAYDWDSLCVRERGHYEPGAFDIRDPAPRPTALAHVARELAQRQDTTHPLLSGPGWWAREERRIYPPSAKQPRKVRSAAERPILITGASGSLGRALTRACEDRQLFVKALSKAEFDVTDRTAVTRVMTALQPWLVINAARYTQLAAAELETETCQRANVLGPTLLAEACSKYRARLVNFSSALVFDGSKASSYLEDDEVCPIGVYGESLAQAEAVVRQILPSTLIVRTGELFGPFETKSFAARALWSVRRGQLFAAPEDCFVSPAYLPHLVNFCLDLAIAHAEGIWHMANEGACSLAAWAQLLCNELELPTSLIQPLPASALRPRPRLPQQMALRSRRAAALPLLSDAIREYAERQQQSQLTTLERASA